MAPDMVLRIHLTALVPHLMDLLTLEWVALLTVEDTDQWVDMARWEEWDLMAGWDRMVVWEVMARWEVWEDMVGDMEEWEEWEWEEATVNLE